MRYLVVSLRERLRFPTEQQQGVGGIEEGASFAFILLTHIFPASSGNLTSNTRERHSGIHLCILVKQVRERAERSALNALQLANSVAPYVKLQLGWTLKWQHCTNVFLPQQRKPLIAAISFKWIDFCPNVIHDGVYKPQPSYQHCHRLLFFSWWVFCCYWTVWQVYYLQVSFWWPPWHWAVICYRPSCWLEQVSVHPLTCLTDKVFTPTQLLVYVRFSVHTILWESVKISGGQQTIPAGMYVIWSRVLSTCTRMPLNALPCVFKL